MSFDSFEFTYPSEIYICKVIQTSGFIQSYKQAKREENVGKLINLIRESSK